MKLHQNDANLSPFNMKSKDRRLSYFKREGTCDFDSLFSTRCFGANGQYVDMIWGEAAKLFILSLCKCIGGTVPGY